VHDAQQEFGLNENIPCYQKIGVLGDCARKRVLDGDDCGADGSALHAIEHFDGTGAGDNLAARQHTFRGFMAKGTEFALDGNFHQQGKVAGASRKVQVPDFGSNETLARSSRRERLMARRITYLFVEHQRIYTVRVIARKGFNDAVIVAFVEG
jgi:hypothetical protein